MPYQSRRDPVAPDSTIGPAGVHAQRACTHTYARGCIRVYIRIRLLTYTHTNARQTANSKLPDRAVKRINPRRSSHRLRSRRVFVPISSNPQQLASLHKNNTTGREASEERGASAIFHSTGRRGWPIFFFRRAQTAQHSLRHPVSFSPGEKISVAPRRYQPPPPSPLRSISTVPPSPRISPISRTNNAIRGGSIDAEDKQSKEGFVDYRHA